MEKGVTRSGFLLYVESQIDVKIKIWHCLEEYETNCTEACEELMVR